MDPEGDVYFVGVGDSNDPPEPPLLNENVDLDGDVFGILLAGVIGSGGALFIVRISCSTMLGDRRTLPLLAFSWLFSFLENEDLPLEVVRLSSECGSDGEIRISHTVAINSTLVVSSLISDSELDGEEIIKAASPWRRPILRASDQ